MIVSHEHRFAFIHIYKTAGDSIASALAPHLGPDDIRTDDLRRQRGFGALEPPTVNKHTTAEDCIALIGRTAWDSYLTFAVVRHPLDRMQSLFHYAAQRNAAWSKTIWHRALRQRLGLIDAPSSWALQRAIAAGDDFSSFIRRPSLQDHPAFQPQVATLSDGDGRLLVRRILRFERLEEDFSHLVADLDLAETPLPHLNRGRPSDTVQLSTEDQDFIMKRYGQDFEAFGYSAQ